MKNPFEPVQLLAESGASSSKKVHTTRYNPDRPISPPRIPAGGETDTDTVTEFQSKPHSGRPFNPDAPRSPRPDTVANDN